MQGHILLVEDDQSICEMVEKYLTKEGYSITTASDGEKAIEEFSRDSFDLILLVLDEPILFFGMRKYSVPTTIISSILIVTMVCSTSNGLTLNDIIAIPITLACIGLFIAYLSIRNIEKVDVIK